MAKNKPASGHRDRTVSEHPPQTQASVNPAKRRGSKPARQRKDVRREVLFPTEPSTIGKEKIDRAVQLVLSRRK